MLTYLFVTAERRAQTFVVFSFKKLSVFSESSAIIL